MKAAMRELSTKHVLGDKNEEEEEASGSCSEEEEQQKEEEFVNTGLQRWEEIRNQWLSSASSSSSSSSSETPTTTALLPQSKKSKITRSKNKKFSKRQNSNSRHAKDIDIDEVIDLIVSNRWRQQPPKNMSSSASSLDTAKNATRRRDDACFPNPVSLPQMVDVLVDLW
eukprot:CAMPEP_0183756412 /NCGR_PEP_ID=MMETSP0739-20130205/5005_1 /TAXON_ID=385413 /ORGANISM="Thalassiosira miniscula, Strain CCMP1093" /LENGTH=168 /DNA_ID=CAMNT_0025993581 /DNA_START=91 /DNA_END=594 /DNA_ORIENTATION=+